MKAGGDEGFGGDVDLFRRGEHLAVEVRIDGADAFRERRVGGPEAGQTGAKTLGEEEVADGGGFAGLETGAEGVAADFFQGAGDALGVARELDGGGVGEVFTLSRHGGLDDAAEEIADVADEEEGETGEDDEGEDAAGVFVAAGAAGDARVAEGPQDAATGESEDEDAEKEGGEAEVKPHVAVEDVAELVSDDALEFVAGEFVERAAGDGDDGVGSGNSGGEGVDGGFVVEDVNGGDGSAGGDGHFLDDVEQATFGEVGGLRGDAAGFDALGDCGATRGELGPFREGGQADDGEGCSGDAEEELGVPEKAGA